MAKDTKTMVSVTRAGDRSLNINIAGEFASLFDAEALQSCLSVALASCSTSTGGCVSNLLSMLSCGGESGAEHCRSVAEKTLTSVCGYKGPTA